MKWNIYSWYQSQTSKEFRKSWLSKTRLSFLKHIIYFQILSKFTTPKSSYTNSDYFATFKEAKISILHPHARNSAIFQAFQVCNSRLKVEDNQAKFIRVPHSVRFIFFLYLFIYKLVRSGLIKPVHLHVTWANPV